MSQSERFFTLDNGYQLPTLGLGTYKADKSMADDTIKTAIDMGYRHFDCAWFYGNEKEIGKAIRDKIAAGDVDRDNLFITTKLWNTFHNPKDVVKMCKESLANLGVDYLDLFLMHWPVAFKKVGNDYLPKKFYWQV